MTRIAPINLAYNPKTLWFDAADIELTVGQHVVVQTARGTEFGTVAEEVFEATEAQLKSLKSELKPVQRVADETDCERARELEEKAAEALPLFKELAAETSEEMRPVSVEYLFDGDKAVFYFESENRVDFRELVRTLSSKLHVRVDMRQIGVRDEARMVGGIGHCGQELCCKRLGGEFCPVSIRMAKEQDLSLNPQKISGVCGRLMCCLRYEYDAYKDFHSRAPKKNATIETPDGPAKVVDLDVPREVISLRIEGEKPVKVPLSEFDEAEEGTRPKCVGCDAWDRANTPDENMFSSGLVSLATPDLNGKDQLADRSSVRHVSSTKKNSSDAHQNDSRSGKQSRRKRRDRSDSSVGSEDAQKQVVSSRKPRRRRSTKVSGAGEVSASQATEASTKQTAQSSAEQRRDGSAERARGAKPRRRDNQASQNNKHTDNSNKRSDNSNKQRAGRKNANQQQSSRSQQPGPRPGQKSSGLSRDGGTNQAASQGGKSASEGKSSSSSRKPRRRSHRGQGGKGQSGQGGQAN